MRKVACVLAASTAVVFGSASSALADSFDIREKWRDCDDLSARLSFKATFTKPADFYGTGRYLIKSQIRWDKHTSAGWRNWDTNTVQTNWLQINNPNYSHTVFQADRTVWSTSYNRRWQAHVIVKLIKNRVGPRDRRVATIERWFSQAMFRERGQDCGVTVGS